MKFKKPISIKNTKEEFDADIFDIDIKKHLKKLEPKKPKNYAEISLRIDGVLTRFIAESEYQSTIDSYENKLKEVQSSMYKIMEAVAEKEKEDQEEVRKSWEYENGVPTNFKVTTVDKEYDFVHPDKVKEIIRRFEGRILDLEQSIAFQKATLNKINRLISDTNPF